LASARASLRGIHRTVTAVSGPAGHQSYQGPPGHQLQVLADVAARLGASAHQVALAWLLQRSPAIVLIPGTSSVAHLRENVAAADLVLPADAIAELDNIGR
jgi:aryl-alcohol dehydrogenase-like predicted oxidoreductase